MKEEPRFVHAPTYNVSQYESRRHLNYPRNRRAVNTSYARRLAEWWESRYKANFPGGIENAYLRHLSPTPGQLAAGHWKWELVTLKGDSPIPIIGSPESVRFCLKNPDHIES